MCWKIHCLLPTEELHRHTIICRARGRACQTLQGILLDLYATCKGNVLSVLQKLVIYKRDLLIKQNLNYKKHSRPPKKRKKKHPSSGSPGVAVLSHCFSLGIFSSIVEARAPLRSNTLVFMSYLSRTQSLSPHGALGAWPHAG